MQQKRVDYILYFVALFLPFFHFLYVFPIFNAPFVFISIASVCTFVYIRLKNKFTMHKHFLIVMLILLVFLLLNNVLIKNSLYYIYNTITEVYANNSSYTFDRFPVIESENIQLGVFFVLICFYIVEMIILYHCILEKANYFVVFLCTFLFFFPSLLYTSPMPWPLTIGLLVLWGYLLFLTFYKKRITMINIGAQSRIFLYVSIVILTVCVSLFTILPPQQYQLTTINANLRTNLLDTMYRFSYNFRFGKEKEGEVDLNLAGNRHYTGEEQFTIERDKSETLYLKTLSTSLYKDNAWSVLPQTIYEQKKGIQWNEVRTWKNAYTRQKENKKETIFINDKRKDKQYALEPYDIYGIHQESGIYYDAYMTLLEEKNSYSYDIWDASSVFYKDSMEGNAYIDFVNKQYLELPKELEELFSNRLYLENIVDDKEIISYVKAYLDKNYSYTLSPGYPPKNSDFITWFLTVNHKGYCVHFASAAVMMFRYYGIPSRYVEGYRVDSYTQDHKGIARDSDAHAWVEIFTPESGWMPIEVTPGFKDVDEDESSSVTTDEPKESENTDTEDEPKENPVQDIQDEQNKNFQKPINDKQTQQQTKESTLHIEISKNILFLIYMIAIFLLIYGQRKLRYYRKRKRMKQTEQRKKVLAWMQYYEKLCMHGAKKNEMIYSLFEKAIYSRKGLNGEEMQQFTSLIEKEKADFFHKLNLRKKLKLRYRDALD